MIALNRRTKIFVCREATDMRSSYDSLVIRAKEVLKKDPMSGHLFLFVNSRRSSIKALYYDGTGLVIISKRLERGLFSEINPRYRGQIALTQAEFSLEAVFGIPGGDPEKGPLRERCVARNIIKKS